MSARKLCCVQSVCPPAVRSSNAEREIDKMRIPFKEWGTGRRVRRRTRPTGTIRVWTILLICQCLVACGEIESTIVLRRAIGSKLLTVTDFTEPSAFGGSKRVITISDSAAFEQSSSEVLRLPQYLDVASVESVDTLLGVITLRERKGPQHPFIILPLTPHIGRLDFPGWWISEWYYTVVQTLENSGYLIEHVALKSDRRDHVLVIRDAAKSFWVFNVYFVDADEMEVYFKDSSTLRVDYSWVGSDKQCEFEVSLGQFVGDQITVRAVGLSARSEE